jgi:hypothetical protein
MKRIFTSSLVALSLACNDSPSSDVKPTPTNSGDSARNAFGRVVDSLLLDTEMHELRAHVSIVVRNPDTDDESPFSFTPLNDGAPPGPHARDGRVHVDVEVLRELLGRDLPVRLDSVNHRFFVGSPEVLIYGHPHGNAWFVPLKLFARQYGAYVDVNCTLATCANIWTRERLEEARRIGAIGTAVLEAHAEGLITIDVRRLPTG